MKSNNSINIFLADEIHPEGIDLLKKKFKVVKLTGLSGEKLMKALISVGGNVSGKSAMVIRAARKIDKNFVKKIYDNTNIRLIFTVSSGFDNIDISACSKYKIKVLNIFGGNSISAAEFTIGIMLAISKNLTSFHTSMKRRIFDNRRITNLELHGKTIGIIGVGRVGSHVAKIAKSLGMKIIGNDIKLSLKNKYKWIKFVPLNTLLRSSDIVTIHTPLDESTCHLLNKNNLKLMSPSSILINCARGGIIDEKALIRLLKQCKIYYAGLDVFENEPKFNKSFSNLSNVMLTPHSAGKTKESYKRMGLMAAEKLINYYQKN